MIGSFQGSCSWKAIKSNGERRIQTVGMLLLKNNRLKIIILSEYFSKPWVLAVAGKGDKHYQLTGFIVDHLLGRKKVDCRSSI